MTAASPRPLSVDDAERGRVLASFRTDPQHELAYARMRTITAVVGGLAASAMLLGELPLPALLIALLGLAIAVLWLRQARRAARSARRGRVETLTVHEHGFALEHGERTHWVPWSNVEGIEVDEDRLDIAVQQSGSAPLRIEPRYPGVDIHELVRTLNDARRAALPATVRRGSTPSP